MNYDLETSMLSDAEIVELLWQRSESGLSRIEGKYNRFCLGLAMNLLGRKEDAEECVNDVYLAVWNTIPPNRPTSLLAYIGKITRNIAITQLRKREALCRSGNGTVLLDELAECLPDTGIPDPADDLTLRDTLTSFLDHLTDDDRTIMIRRYYNGDPIESIAKDMRLRSGTVRVRLHRLRERLRKHLQANGISL